MKNYASVQLKYGFINVERPERGCAVKLSRTAMRKVQKELREQETEFIVSRDYMGKYSIYLIGDKTGSDYTGPNADKVRHRVFRNIALPSGRGLCSISVDNKTSLDPVWIEDEYCVVPKVKWVTIHNGVYTELVPYNPIK